MRVLVVGLNYAPEPTGIAPYTTALTEGLAARGHDVLVLTAMPHYPEWRIREGYNGWTRKERMNGVRVTRLRHRVPCPPTGVQRLLSELSFGVRVVASRWANPDVVVFVSPALFSTALGLLRARLTHPELPIVTWVQDLYTLGVVETGTGSAGGVVARVMRRVEEGVLTRSTRAVVIHERFADTARTMVRGDHLVVIRNWTHLRPVDTTPDQRVAMRKQLGWGENEIVVLHAGNMGAKQDLRNVVEAARIADDCRSPVRFVLMGHGRERAALERLARGVQRISFADPLPGEQYQHALAAADVLLVNEHVGLRGMAVPSKLTSYFSSGRPIVCATDAESVTAAELQASGAGVQVSAADPRALLDAVLYVDHEADEFGVSGRAFMDRMLSEKAAIDRFEAILREVASPRRHRPKQGAGHRHTAAQS